MFYVHNRWLGGMLTNFQTIRKSIDRLNYLEHHRQRTGPSTFTPKRSVCKLARSA